MSTPQSLAPVFCRKIPSRINEVESLCIGLREFLIKNNLGHLSFPVELLCRECLMNALTHGNRNNAEKSIDFRIYVGRLWIRLQVGDEGPGFNWRKMRQRELDTDATCGRGLKLYAIYAARVRFNRRGNQITLWMSKKSQTGKGN